MRHGSAPRRMAVVLVATVALGASSAVAIAADSEYGVQTCPAPRTVYT